MTGLFENASFGTVFQTKDGGKAVYLCYIPFNNLHKLFVEGFEYPFLYHANGKRRGNGKYARLYGTGLDVVKQI